MRLAIIMPSGTAWGGSEEALIQFAAQASSVGVQALAITLLEPGEMEDRLTATGAVVAVREAGRLRNPLRWWQTVRRLRHDFRQFRPDAVLGWMTKAHCYAAPAAAMAGVACGYYQMGLPDGGLVDRLSRLWPVTGGVIGCSRFVAEEQARAIRRPVEAVRLAMDPARFDPERMPAPAAMRRQLGLPEGGPLIGITGRLQRWKGMHVFAGALARLRERHPELRGVIVGGTHEWEPDYPEFLRKTIASVGMTDRMILVGRQPHPAEWMQAMDVCVHASEREPFGLVVVEAMALGKPVVAAIPGGPSEVIIPEVTGLLTPWGDEAALATAIDRYLTEPDFAAACGRAAREAALAYGPTEYADRLVAVLRQWPSRSERRGR